MNSKGNFVVRLAFYIFGLMIMTVGVVLSVKSDLGVSPVSSVPYTMTCVAGIELGKATIIFSVAMVLVQLVLLRKQFKLINLLQLPVGILFGLFMTFCCNLAMSLPTVENFTMRFVLMFLSTLIIAIGVFMYVPAGFIPLAPEGAMLAVARITKKKFADIKLISDISMVVFSGIVCFIVLGELGSVGIGTLVAAVLVGIEVKCLGRFLGDARDSILGLGVAIEGKQEKTPLLSIMKRDVYVVKQTDSILDALKLMKEKKISGCPVVDAQDNLVGFISDGDIIRHLAAEHSIFVNSESFEKIAFNHALRDVVSKTVSDLATKKVITVNAHDDLDEVCYILGEHHLKKAPVMEHGKMIGIINVSNVIKYAVDLMD